MRDDDVVGFTAAPTKSESTKLTKLGQRLAELDREIQTCEERLDEAKKLRLELATKTLPEYMISIGQDRVGLPEYDVDLVLEDYYHANISADWEPARRADAFAWLENNDAGDLVKVTVSVDFGRGDLEKARELERVIQEWRMKFNAPVSAPVLSMGVAWNTLTAWVKDRISRGEALPLETLGATVGRVAKLKKRKAKSRSI